MNQNLSWSSIYQKNCHKNWGPGCPCCPTSDGSHTNTLVGTNEPFSIPKVGWGQTNGYGSFWNSLQPQPQRIEASWYYKYPSCLTSKLLAKNQQVPSQSNKIYYISVSSFRISNTPLFTSTTLSPPQQKPSIKRMCLKQELPKRILSIVCMATTFLAVSAHYWSTSINLISFPCFPLWWWKPN